MFDLTKEQVAKLNAFTAQQEVVTGGRYGAIGGAYTYEFTPTSIGVVVKVRNSVTNAVIDLTDYESW